MSKNRKWHFWVVMLMTLILTIGRSVKELKETFSSALAMYFIWNMNIELDNVRKSRSVWSWLKVAWNIMYKCIYNMSLTSEILWNGTLQCWEPLSVRLCSFWLLLTSGTKSDPYIYIKLFFVCRSKLNSNSHSKTRKRHQRVAKQAGKPSAKRSLSFNPSLLRFSGDFYLKSSSCLLMALQTRSYCHDSAAHILMFGIHLKHIKGLSNDVYSVPVQCSLTKYYRFENA